MTYKQDHHQIKFKCAQCGRCCRQSSIRISPYDILRLCSYLNMSSSDFLEKHVYFIRDPENQDLLTAMLKTSPECLFLDSDGCSVYSKRPFACRVYPLAIDPFYDGKELNANFYVLEKCPGFRTNKKISLEEFKSEQQMDNSSIYDPWMIFKIKMINSNFPKTEEFYRQFSEICYNFDGEYFRQLLGKKNLDWPESIDEKYKTIIKLAEEELLS